MRRKREFPLVMAGLTAVALMFLLVCLLIGKLLDGRRYYDRDFGFEPYISSTDANGDGVENEGDYYGLGTDLYSNLNTYYWSTGNLIFSPFFFPPSR